MADKIESKERELIKLLIERNEISSVNRLQGKPRTSESNKYIQTFLDKNFPAKKNEIYSRWSLIDFRRK